MTKRDFFKHVLIIINFIPLIPYILLMKWGPNNKVIKKDLSRWAKILSQDIPNRFGTTFFAFLSLMTFYPEYRSLFYYRLGWIGKILSASIFYRPMSTLYIWTKDIGPGLFIQHGFSTIIGANKIGENCWINQQVTIGFSNDTDCPTINDNVIISAGAKVIGDVTIGSNSIVGANAVVVKDVPEKCIVVGIPAYIIRKDGVKTKESL